MAEHPVRNTILSLALLAGAIAVALLAFGFAAFALAFAVPVVVHGTLAGVELAPVVAAVASGGVGLLGAAGAGVVVYQVVKQAEDKPFRLAVPVLAIANGMLMAVAYELLPDKGAAASVLDKILVSGLSASGLVVGAVVFDRPGVWSKVVGAILHVVFQAVTIAWLAWTAWRNEAVREEMLKSLWASPLAIGLAVLAGLTVLPALGFLAWNARAGGKR